MNLKRPRLDGAPLPKYEAIRKPKGDKNPPKPSKPPSAQAD